MRLDNEIPEWALCARFLDSHDWIEFLAMGTDRWACLHVNYRILGEVFQRIGGPFDGFHSPPKHFIL
jgi:hypothetical protein